MRFFDRENAGATWVVAVDTTICGIFAVEFAWRWRKTGWQRRYPLTHWYEVIGMIPVTEPALRGFRLLRVVVVLVRVARAGYRVFGERITRAMIETTLRVTLEVLADPRVDEFVTDVVRRNQERIRATVLAHLEGERA
ncbi:hypothetical protein [Thermocrispum agreste]|uniref:hypothetical protein n=1 Tax=Thermocrispum agreste TaxID=37925 RepID=UPI000417D8FA|nr:hypothetical protein [Thermocrispum agreste]